ncbi:MAG: GNAT family N-acetyltransferase [Proteobacteria bacterium]|nr:GNAT family N-acetyltransferase [Pseudomonadota bacterium]
MRLELLDGRDARVAPIWNALEGVGHPSYFLTWGWIENWLACLPREDTPRLAVIRDGDAVVGAFFLGRRLLWRHHVLPSRGAFVNTTGVENQDELCIEHNAILCAPDRVWSLADVVELIPHDWDELFLPGIDRASIANLTVPDGYRVVIDRETSAPFVDLERVRATGDYLSLLSANTRSQIRRARRRVGPLALEVASSVASALAIYDELVALHTVSWHDRDQPGAFVDPWFDHFHRRLITERFASGEVQLLRLRAGDATLGCLYNFNANGRVLFYQSGLVAQVDPVVKPGLLCHAAAIDHAAAAGHACYDLLGGDGRYKLSLATDATPLVWVRIQRTHVRFAIEDRARHWKHALVDKVEPDGRD